MASTMVHPHPISPRRLQRQGCVSFSLKGEGLSALSDGVVGVALKAPSPWGRGLGVGTRGRQGARPMVRLSAVVLKANDGCLNWFGHTPTQPSPSRGRALLSARYFDCAHDFGDYAVGVAEHVVVPEADDTVAVGFDQFGAFDVGGVLGMLAAVNFDDQFERAAGKVSDRQANRELPRKLHAQLFAAQPRPQARFGLGRFSAKALGGAGQALSCHSILPKNAQQAHLITSRYLLNRAAR